MPSKIERGSQIHSPQIISRDLSLEDPKVVSKLLYSKALFDVGGQVEIIPNERGLLDDQRIDKEFEAFSKYRIALTFALGIHRLIFEEAGSLDSFRAEVLEKIIHGMSQKGLEIYISSMIVAVDGYFGPLDPKEEEGSRDELSVRCDKELEVGYETEASDPKLTMRGALALSVLTLGDYEFPGSGNRAKAKQVLREDSRAEEIYKSNDLFHHSPDEIERRLPHMEV